MTAPAHSVTAQVVLPAVTLSAMLLIFFVLPQPIWAGHPSPPPAPGQIAAEPLGAWGLLAAGAFCAAVCAPFRPYVLALRTPRLHMASPRLLLGTTAGLALVALLIYPSFGSDVFEYIGFERMWAIYGDNPLQATPASRPEDWASSLVWFANQPPAYGPLWWVLTWPIARLAGDSPSAAVAGYKVLSAAAYAACCALIWVSVEPARRRRALLLFAWSPLVLFEVLAKAHNDVLPALTALLSIWLLTRGRDQLSLLAGVVGGLVKLTALATAPPVALRLWRSGGWRPLLAGAAAAALLTAAVYAPFWQPPAIFSPVWTQANRVVWSPGSLVIAGATWLTGGPRDEAVRLVFGLAWLLSCAIVLGRSRLDRSADVARTSGWVFIASVLLLTTAVFGHYLVPAIALAAVAGDRRLERVVLWLSIGGLAAYSVELLSLALGAEWLGSRGYQAVGSLVLLGPAVIAELNTFRSGVEAAGERRLGHAAD